MGILIRHFEIRSRLLCTIIMRYCTPVIALTASGLTFARSAMRIREGGGVITGVMVTVRHLFSPCYTCIYYYTTNTDCTESMHHRWGNTSRRHEIVFEFPYGIKIRNITLVPRKFFFFITHSSSVSGEVPSALTPRFMAVSSLFVRFFK